MSAPSAISAQVRTACNLVSKLHPAGRIALALKLLGVEAGTAEGYGATHASAPSVRQAVERYFARFTEGMET